MDSETQARSGGKAGSLTGLEQQVLRIADSDCPLRQRSAWARAAIILRLLTGRRLRWMRRPLANSRLEALRLFFCLQRYPDPVLMPLVQEQLETSFDDRVLRVIAAKAAQGGDRAAGKKAAGRAMAYRLSSPTPSSRTVRGRHAATGRRPPRKKVADRSGD